MSLVRIYISILIVLVFISNIGNSETILRKYFIKKDFFSGFKSGEFSIYDSINNLKYRIESDYAVGINNRLIDASSKQVIGKLKNAAGLLKLKYKANLTILDLSSDRWIKGTIEQIFNMISDKYLIKLNGFSIIMAHTFPSLTTTFEYENHSGILAQIRKQPISFISSNKYDLQILSDKLPDAFYILLLTVRDQATSRGKG